MKKSLFMICIFSVIFINAQDCSELFFSEYVEGYSQNKALEIYNPTQSSIDLGQYKIERYSNGSTNSSAGGITNLSGVIASGDVFVITNGETDTTAQFGFCDPALRALGDFSEPNGSYPTPLHMNGNDAIVLTKNGAPIDIIGRVGEDPASGAWTDDVASGFTMGTWWTAQHTLIRKSTVLEGDKDGTDLFNPSLDWDSLPVGCWDNLGEHTCDCFPNQIYQVKTCPPTSINEEKAASFLIYPNPVTKGNKVNVQTTSKIKSMTLTNVLGEKIQVFNVINTSKLSKGIYILGIEFFDAKNIQTKIIIH